MKYKILLLTAITFITTCLGASGKNILSLKESITDNAIVFPSSFETNTKDMMENWYLKNYAIIDESNIETRDYGLKSDAEYIKRLKQLPTVIEMPFNQIVRSYIERYVVKSRTLVAQMLGMCPYYMPIFEEALERHNMPMELKYIPIIESALNPNAVSPAGAGGLWQFMVTTAKGVGLNVNSQIDERRDPYRSSEKAAVYFKQLYDTYKDWSLAIAAYNCGPGNVNKAIRRAGTDNPDFWEIYNYLPRETRGYVPAFIAANYVMTYYREHNINPTLTKKPLIIDTVQVNKRIYLDQISQVLNIPLDEIKILNPQYRGNVIPGDVRPYTLALPSQQIYSYIMAEDKIENYHKTQFEPREKVEPGDIRSIVDEMEAQDGIIWHEVTDGENFIDIADRYGMQYDDLMELNNLTTTTLHPGQTLKVINKNAMVGETVMRPSSSGNSGYSSDNSLMADNSYDNNYSNDYNNNSYNSNNNYSNSSNKNNGSNYAASTQRVPEKKTTVKETKPDVPKPKQTQTPKESFKQDQPKTNNTAKSNETKNANVAKKDDKKATTAKVDDKKAATTKVDDKKTANKNNKKDDKKTAEKKKEQPKKVETKKHSVKEGDNLTRLAEKYNVSADDIRAANNISGDNIQIGHNLVIPEKGYSKKHPSPKAKEQAKPAEQPKAKNNSKNKQESKQQNTKDSKAKEQPKQQNAKNNSKNSKGNNNAVQPKANNKGKKK